MPEKETRRVFIKQHGLPELFGKTMDQGDGGPMPIENHQVRQLYGGSSSVNVGPTTAAGSTAHFTVGYETDLGTAGATAALEVLSTCEADYKALSAWFKLAIPKFNVVIARVSAETLDLAYHESCYSTDLYCDAPGPGEPPYYTSALMASETAETFEAYQHKGWDCGSANGEGLSRVLGAALHPGALDHHACAPAWLDGGRMDLVNYNYPTDTNQLANGCSVLFLNWLHYHLGYEWGNIVGAAAPTLAATYRLLTGSKEDPFPRFKAFMATLFPPTRSWASVPDEPFGPLYASASDLHDNAARDREERQRKQRSAYESGEDAERLDPDKGPRPSAEEKSPDRDWRTYRDPRWR
jgi:hypothetical protein